MRFSGSYRRIFGVGLLLAVIFWTAPAQGGTQDWGKETGHLVRALLVAPRQATLSSEIDAKVIHLRREGEAFRQDEDLVRFDCRLHETRLASKDAELEAARKTLHNDRQLWQRGAAGQLQVDLAEVAEKKALAERHLVQLVVKQCRIKAPFSGAVVTRHIHEHELAGPGDTLLTIVDNGTLEVETVVPSAWLAWLKPGQPVQLHLDETDRDHSLKVTRIIPAVDPVSQSVRVISLFEKPCTGLAAGMSGSARFTPPNPATSP